VVDSSEEMRDREQENLRQLSNHSRLVAAAVLHEVRNLCSAISVVYSNLKERNEPCRVEEIQGLEALITGLSRVASLELYGNDPGSLEGVPLQQVLDDLRIIIEPSWQEIGGSVCWMLSDATVRVLADRYGLMQVFLNLAQNSHRAVQASPVRKLSIRAETCNQRAVLRFEDTGCGIRDPQRLFQPFQQGADVTGLGLFISRVLVRSYGGELRFQPVETGCSFVLELPLLSTRKTYA
jgi:two-component system sensor kinase FixL